MTNEDEYIPIETSEFHQGPQTFDCTLTIAAAGFPELQAELGAETLRLIAGSVGDHPSQMELLSRLAHHPASSVREAVASRDCLSDGAVLRLMRDPDRAVRLALFWSAAFRRSVSEDWLLEQAEADTGFACDLVREIEEFGQVDAREVLQRLSRFSDPAVRAAVAHRREVGKASLKRLSGDDDPEVRLRALDTMAS